MKRSFNIRWPGMRRGSGAGRTLLWRDHSRRVVWSVRSWLWPLYRWLPLAWGFCTSKDLVTGEAAYYTLWICAEAWDFNTVAPWGRAGIDAQIRREAERRAELKAAEEDSRRRNVKFTNVTYVERLLGPEYGP